MMDNPDLQPVSAYLKKPLSRAKYISLMIIIFSAILMLIGFNLGGWLLYSKVVSILDQEVKNRLMHIGKITVGLLQKEGLLRPDFSRLDEGTKVLIYDLLKDIKEKSNLYKMVILDKGYKAIVDSETLPEEKKDYTYIRLDKEVIDKAWAGHAQDSKIYAVASVYFKSVYIPIYHRSVVNKVLCLEDSIQSLAIFQTIRNSLALIGIISVFLILTFIVSQIYIVGFALRAQAKIKENEKLTSLGAVGASIAHEIRNPLGIISGTAEVLKSRYLKTAKLDVEMLEFIPKEIDRLNKIISDYLLFAREPKYDFVRTDLCHLLTEVIAQCRADFGERGIALALQYETEIKEIRGDRNKLTQVFLNLLINAKDAIELKGEILLKVTHSKKEEVTLQITDNGKGIPNEQREMMFEPFFSTKAKGTGLGLAISKKIIEAHQGTIRIQPNQPKGSVIIITLPVGG